MHKSANRLLQSAWAAGCRADSSRLFSSLRETASKVLVAGEAVRVSERAPVLLQLPERPWGPSATLDGKLVDTLAGGHPERVGVVRAAFAPHYAKPTPLQQLLVPLGHDAVAVSSRLSSAYERQVVDEYRLRPDGTYQLQTNSVDLVRLLRLEGVRVAWVPSVEAAAAQPRLNSVAAASSGGPRQSTNEILMVAPTAFGFNEQAAADNAFMHATAGAGVQDLQASQEEAFAEAGAQHAPRQRNVTSQVLREFSMLYRVATESFGVKVSLFQHDVSHGTPDAVFPNNWFSTHPAGEALGGVREPTVIWYPMKYPNRAAERREDMKAVVRMRGYTREVDWSHYEAQGRAFEGTGVVVPDRINGIAYVALSERADPGLAAEWADLLGYRDLVTFRSTDGAGKPVYHTNVMMAVGTDAAVVCSESVEDEKEREHLLARLRRHHKVIEITREQMGHMCGNAIELEDGRGLPVLAMSRQAHDAFTAEQKHEMRKHFAGFLHAPITTLEHIGGGSVRCTTAELF